MAKPKKTPGYRLHKPSGQAYVRINGKFHYLGEYGSPESRDRYDELIADWLAGHGPDRHSLTIDELCLRYFKHAKTHYRKNGKPTSEQSCIQSALRPLITLFGRTRAAEFGPLKLGQYRDDLISRRFAISTIRKHVGRVRSMFKWAASLEMVHVSVYQALLTLPALQAGRTEAWVPDPVEPVPREHIRRARHDVVPAVRGLIDFQLLTGARPGEAVSLTLRQIDMSGDVWRYVPESHKTEHHGKQRVLFIGPRAQTIVRLFMDTSMDAPVFRHARGRYTIHGYRWGIRRSCNRQGIEVWSPNQLRHNAATALRRRVSIEDVRTVLGHSSAVTSEIYAEKDMRAAADVMRRLG